MRREVLRQISGQLLLLFVFHNVDLERQVFGHSRLLRATAATTAAAAAVPFRRTAGYGFQELRFKLGELALLFVRELGVLVHLGAVLVFFEQLKAVALVEPRL